jgi:hypothetical protein
VVDGYQPSQPAYVLRDGCERELILCTARTAKSKAPKPQNTVEVREQHLGALALST